MMMAAELARILGGRKSGSGWMAPCPSHDDRNASLSLNEVNGKVLVHDFGGCPQRRVIGALTARGLWEPARPFVQPRRQIVATYDYTDDKGSLLYQVCRTDPKGFLQRYPDGHGGWIWKKHPHQILYRLPEVTQAPIIFLPEGEKDCESLRGRGFVATTNAGGAKAPWLPSFAETLAGREVILIPDADEPGRQRVLRIAPALLGHVAKVIVFVPEGAKDITEWFEQGHSELELIEQVERGSVTK